MEKIDGKTKDLVGENREVLVEMLKDKFPEVVSEGDVDLVKLSELLGGDGNVDSASERYNFTWAGKAGAIRNAMAQSSGTLRVAREDSVNWDSTENIYIEGDNLEVLKLLQKSYARSIKMIYIDPPYNTGNDFVYKDDFKDNIKNYLQLTGQVDSDGKKLSTNTETSGRYHSDWLNMMYPRLKLARNLLKDDGVIFISIDDNEVSNLRKLCDEIFGEENFVAQLVWAAGRKNDSKHISISHEYILAYFKDFSKIKEYGIIWREKKQGLEDIYREEDKLRKKHGNDYTLISKKLKEWYNALPNGDPAKDHRHYSKVDKKGIYFPDNISWPGGGGPDYELINPETGIKAKVPSRGWLTKKETMLEWIKLGRVDFGEEGSVPCLKSYLKERELSVPYSVFYQDGRASSKRLMSLFGSKIFENPKDEEIIGRLVGFSMSEKDSIVLDFFSGSATTAHAVMQLNKEDGGNRKFICVQLPEQTDENSEAYTAGYKNICEIGKERIRRVIKKLEAESPAIGNNQDELNFEAQESPKAPLDLGFKVFKLDSSNFSAWDTNPENLDEDTLLKHVNNIKENRSTEDILYELLLKLGEGLNTPYQKVKLENKTVFDIAYGSILACLDDDLDMQFCENLIAYHETLFPKTDEQDSTRSQQERKEDSRHRLETTSFIFKDTNFKDPVIKSNIIQTLRQLGFENIKVI